MIIWLILTAYNLHSLKNCLKKKKISLAGVKNGIKSQKKPKLFAVFIRINYCIFVMEWELNVILIDVHLKNIVKKSNSDQKKHFNIPHLTIQSVK